MLKIRHSILRLVEILLLSGLTIFGVLISLKVGLSYDEDAEFRTYLVNIAAISGLLAGDTKPYMDLTQYFDRYYGIGFHIITHGIGGWMYRIFGDLLSFSELGSRLIWGHASVFLAFIGSGIVFRFCLIRLTGDQLISSLGMFAFLLWPYLFGHSMMNIKDIPFMTVWLCCTLQVLRIFQAPQLLTQPLVWNFALLGALTAWLISIRVAGILIFIEFAWFAIIYLSLGNQLKNNISHYLKFGRDTFVFFIVLIIFLWILYPIAWHDPRELLNAIRYMSSHPWLGNTLTAGELIEPKTRLLFYIGSWLLVKLPVFALVGLAITPIVLWKSIVRKQFSNKFCALLALLLSVVTILSVLVLMRVSLYNELRQVLFISAILLLIAIVSLYYTNRLLSVALLILTIGVMVTDIIKMHPYQYTYINELARNVSKGRLFETDYFGLGVSETAHWLNQSSVDGASQCVYVPSAHLWRFVISPDKFPCVENFPGDLSLIKKPFLFFVQSRSFPVFAAPAWCDLIHMESRKLPISATTLHMGELYKCLPVP